MPDIRHDNSDSPLVGVLGHLPGQNLIQGRMKKLTKILFDLRSTWLMIACQTVICEINSIGVEIFPPSPGFVGFVSYSNKGYYEYNKKYYLGDHKIDFIIIFPSHRLDRRGGKDS